MSWFYRTSSIPSKPAQPQLTTKHADPREWEQVSPVYEEREQDVFSLDGSEMRLLELQQKLDEMKEEHNMVVQELKELKEKGGADSRNSADAKEKLHSKVAELRQRVKEISLERDKVRREGEDQSSALSKENDALKTDRQRIQSEAKKAIEEMNRARIFADDALQDAKKILADRNHRLDEQHVHMDSVVKENATVKAEAKAIAAKSASLEKELATKKAQLAEIKEAYDRQRKDLKALNDESVHIKKQYNQLLALLEDRTSELKGAQSFLTTADAFSGAEVISTLQKLNAEILQSTAFMAESMEASFAFEKRDTPTEEQTAASQKIANAVGTNVVFFLQSKQHKDDPILIQIAFQAFFAVYLRWLSQTWIIGDRAHDQFLDTVYSRIRNSEAQAIAGRWRALTRAHIQPTQLDESQSTATLVTAIVDGLSSILIAAGCTAPRQDLCDALSKKFNDKIALMIGLAIRINRIIGEDVTSGNLEIVAIQSAAPFDKNNMEDAYEDGHTEPTNSRVLCPTDLGLRRLTRAAINGQSHWEEKLLLKPKVALESVVDNMDD